MNIPFNKPFLAGHEVENILAAQSSGHLSGDGSFTKKVHAWLEREIGCAKALMTHSCTAALEMSALLADLKPGDEIIAPSFTFVSTVNAFVLRGAIPVFVDVREDTLNLDETKIEAAITPRTKAIVVVHYAGVPCQMNTIQRIALDRNLLIIEDAAQAIGSRFLGKPAGSFGQMGALSFHETKNVISGEGGALLLNDSRFVERAEIIREKGTNRSRFFRGQVDKYSWVDVGSSFLPSELVAAFLFAQFAAFDRIQSERMRIWRTYDECFAQVEAEGLCRRPRVPLECEQNAHMYYLLLPSLQARTEFINEMKIAGINCVFHYVPLHSSEGGKRFGRAGVPLPQTDAASDRLVRLPLWIGLDVHLEHVTTSALKALRRVSAPKQYKPVSL